MHVTRPNLKLFGAITTILRNNRGRGNRRNTTVGRSGLGNRNTIRPATNGRRAAIVEPSSMESRLVNGSPDPTVTPDRAVFTRTLLGTTTQFTGSSSLASLLMAGILVYENQAATGSSSTTAARFNEGRIKRIEVWDTASNEATDTPLIVTVGSSIQSGGDGAVFRDYGTPGERRAHVAIIPNFALRERWFSSTDTTVLVVLPTSGAQIVRLTLELR